MLSEAVAKATQNRIETEADRILSIALDIGEKLLESGAEIRRVEDTVDRICRAYGAIHVEVFVIVSMLNVQIQMADGSHSTQIRRVYDTGTDLYRLELYNDISRHICQETSPLDQVEEMLRKAKKKKPYPWWIAGLLGSILASGGFAIFFGGTIMDGVVAALIGLLMGLVARIEVKRINSLAKILINAFLAGILSCLAVSVGFGDNAGMIMIGTIMLQIPGVAFSSALRDLLCGDVLAGSLKTVQAVLSALMIAFGYLLSMLLMPTGVTEPIVHSFALQMLTAVIGTVGFSLIFRVRAIHLPFAAIGGLLTYFVYYSLEQIGWNLFLISFLGAVAGAVYSEIAARFRRAPVILFVLPSMVPIIPGGALYRTMDSLINKRYESLFDNFGGTVSIGLGMAGGIVAVSVLAAIIVGAIEEAKTKKG